MGRLFGTDGVRGIANKELTPELAMNIGRAAAYVLGNSMQKKPKILIGKDTRMSSDMLEGALIAGICSAGADVELLGVVPTPTVAFLVNKYDTDAGIMISASHNPFEFNGIKIFNNDGYKLPDIIEDKIESIILDKSEVINKTGANIGTVKRSNNALKDYIEHIKKTIDGPIDGIKVAIDCSNGSSSVTAEKLFSELGVDYHIISNSPNGFNINDECGSTHIYKLSEYVKENKMDVGIAFDGDADRCLAVDEKGNLIDGDIIMAICAFDMKNRGILKKNTVVGTVMSNLGFIKFCKENGMNFISTKVGDRYVLETMLRENYNFGGEQSGHVIFLDHSSTGDGQLTAVQLLSVMKRSGKKISELASIMKKCPQVMKNVTVTADGKIDFYTNEDIRKKIEEAKRTLGEDGRVVVRLSGTEPLVRVMVEGNDVDFINYLAEDIANTINEKL